MKLRKIFILSGHSNHDPSNYGYVTDNYSEGDLTVHLRHLISKKLRQLGANSVNVSNSRRSNIVAWLQNIFSIRKNIIVDIHFNHRIFKQSSGVETLIRKKYSDVELKLAHDISNIIHAELGIVKRGNVLSKFGIKTDLDSHHGRQHMLLLHGENVLLETCFMTNNVDMSAYILKKDIIADKIANVLYTLSIIETHKSYHIVKFDESLYTIAFMHDVSISKLRTLNHLKSDVIKLDQIIKLS